MTIAFYSKFSQYKNLIQNLSSITPDTIKNETFLLEKDEKKQLEMYYAPFEYVNEQAKVVIIGITPGLNQMEKSYSTVLNSKNMEVNDETILSQVKNNSSFEGTMRKNLVQMLDELQLHEYLNITSTMELFSNESQLVHTTSVISYPVFYKGENYSGSTPNMLTNEILKKYVTEHFTYELTQIEQPLLIPLGAKVSKVLDDLVQKKMVDSKLILNGFPHPSGANGSRKKTFAANKEQMKEKLRNHFQSYKY
jgi:hypothetical protein